MIFQIIEYIKNFLRYIGEMLALLNRFGLYYKPNYNNILEFPKDYNINDDLKIINDNEKLYIEIIKFVLDNEYFKNGIIISLSGGVDSMVVLRLLIEARKIKFFDIYAVMVNYNLREESVEETRFIEEYCNKNDIKLTVTNIDNFSDRKNLGSSKRREFEEISKDKRFSSYQKIIDEEGVVGVIFGHHKDDIIENIFTNMLKGHNILDIEVMKHKNIIKGVTVFRPLLNYYKSDIFDFAHKYQIPYFMDTTPSWSRRGQMRNLIFPLLSSVFGDSWKHKLKEIGNQSNLLFDTVNENLINPWIDIVNFDNLSSNKKFVFELPIRHRDDICLWYYTIPKLFYMKGYNCIKKKSIEKLFDIANTQKSNPCKIYTLDKGFTASKIDEKIYIFYDNSNLEKSFIYEK
tara:strand:- start:90 stop:1298 length:1209 start_codon:yes stop_codon:yes gene_type:complete